MERRDGENSALVVRFWREESDECRDWFLKVRDFEEL